MPLEGDRLRLGTGYMSLVVTWNQLNIFAHCFGTKNYLRIHHQS